MPLVSPEGSVIDLFYYKDILPLYTSSAISINENKAMVYLHRHEDVKPFVSRCIKAGLIAVWTSCDCVDGICIFEVNKF